MYNLMKFLKSKNLEVVVKSSEYSYIIGHIVECNPYYVRIKDKYDTLHINSYEEIIGIGLSQDNLPQHKCILNKLPLKYPPYSWTNSKDPNPMIIELIRLQRTLPGNTYINIFLTSTEIIQFKLEDIYEINSTFVFICMESPSNPNYIIPLALVCSKIANIDILSDVDH